jgi:phosphoribosylformylglycinamidine cyclo-ligase
VKAGDVLIGLPSTGLHTNGYSLARKLLFESANWTIDTYIPELGATVGGALLAVHKSYRKAILALLDEGILHAAAHITGGGMTDNIPRVLPPGLMARIQTGSWDVPPLFELLRRLGNMPEDDWRRTLNCGIGMVLLVPAREVDSALRLLRKDKPRVIGEVAKSGKGNAGVTYVS